MKRQRKKNEIEQNDYVKKTKKIKIVIKTMKENMSIVQKRCEFVLIDV
jgi:hypothetical protein